MTKNLFLIKKRKAAQNGRLFEQIRIILIEKHIARNDAKRECAKQRAIG